MWRPKVSIIIPVYNGSNFLREAIDSALQQDYPNFEVVVVNDGSKDYGLTESIARSYGDKIRYFHKENGGVSTALNLGIEVMQGEYFSWLSHDDLYVTNKVSTQIAMLEKQQEKHQIVFSDYVFINEKDEVLDSVSMSKVNPARMEYNLIQSQNLHGCTLLIPRQAFEKVGTFKKELRSTQDYDLWLRMSEYFSFVYCPEKLVKARVHEEQGSRSPEHIAEVRNFFVVESARMTKEKMMRFFHQSELPEAWADLIKTVRHYPDTENTVQSLTRLAKVTLDQDGFIKFQSFLNENKVKKMLLRTREKIKSLFLQPARKNVQRLDFTNIFKNNLFNGTESVSGEGSSLKQTEVLRAELPKILEKYEVKTFLDIPCGDFNWMKLINFKGVNYIGADVVKEVVEQNMAKYGNEHITFRHLNLFESDLPKVDAIFCRDCLVHLNFEDGMNAIKNIKKSGSKYLLSTTFTNRSKNQDLLGNDIWRPLNLEKKPYNLPKPLFILNENCSEGDGKFRDKCIAVWRIEDL